jgi:Vitelline membrane outer layer protein I (VOMI)
MKKNVWIASSLVISFITSTLTASAATFRNDITGVKNAPNATPWGGWSTAIYCPAGSYVGGYSMRVEPNQGAGDDTALNAVALYCYDRAGNMVERIVPHPGFWGNWGEGANCPKGTYAVAFKLKVEPGQGNGDDTGANSVTFGCSNSTVIEASGGGQWGTWTRDWLTGPPNSAICGVRAKVEPEQGKGDDTALNDLEFTWCKIQSSAPPTPQPSTPNPDNSGIRLFENPLGENGIPIDVALKGANGLDPSARQFGADAFCRSKGYGRAVNFQFASGSNRGTWQFDTSTGRWTSCPNCGMYFTRVACQ